jgi:hypothetical protein
MTGTMGILRSDGKTNIGISTHPENTNETNCNKNPIYYIMQLSSKLSEINKFLQG